MEKFKGGLQHNFTLVELIVIILALILTVFIVIPNVKLTFKKIEINNAIDTAYSYKENVNNFYMSQLLLDNSFKLDGEYNVIDGNLIDGENNVYDVKIGGNKPSSGYLTYDNNKLESGCIVINGFSVMILDGIVSYIDSCEGIAI